MDGTTERPRWHLAEPDPELDAWPDDHHAQPDTDPPDLPPADA